MLDELLEKVGLKFEDLNSAERDTLFSWHEALTKNALTLEGVRQYIISMKESVEAELTVSKVDTKQDLLLKARLRNYMLLEAFLSTPEKATKALERAISGMVSTKK